VATIAGGPWQREHITKRHRVRAADFDDAWHDPFRKDVGQSVDPTHGPYYESLGMARGKILKMVWRFRPHSNEVWPITAYFLKGRRHNRRRAR